MSCSGVAPEPDAHPTLRLAWLDRGFAGEEPEAFLNGHGIAVEVVGIRNRAGFQLEERRWKAAHHPFTSPNLALNPQFEDDPAGAKALAYDLVLNGNEIGGGSVRIHDQDVQRRLFGVLGLSPDEAESMRRAMLAAASASHPSPLPSVTACICRSPGESTQPRMIPLTRMRSKRCVCAALRVIRASAALLAE